MTIGLSSPRGPASAAEIDLVGCKEPESRVFTFHLQHLISSERQIRQAISVIGSASGLSAASAIVAQPASEAEDPAPSSTPEDLRPKRQRRARQTGPGPSQG